jgi:hypothetical protein
MPGVREFGGSAGFSVEGTRAFGGDTVSTDVVTVSAGVSVLTEHAVTTTRNDIETSRERGIVCLDSGRSYRERCD